eukprot:m.101189 g.101189  ORF g.101189 m.101189 type:complete len:164 (+) comp12571_c2_seq1:96-587(+)
MLKFTRSVLDCGVRRATVMASTKAVVGAGTYPPQIVTNESDADASPKVLNSLEGTPVKQLETRKVRITVPARNVMQSGDAKLNKWVLTWDTQKRWTNPMMGWTSASDPMASLDLKFDSEEDAIEFCKKKGWSFYVHEPCRRRRMVKNYGFNFSWDKRTRKNTK